MLSHLDTAPHRGLQLSVDSRGWVQSGRDLGHRSWQVDTVSHKCCCSESHCRPGMEEPGAGIDRYTQILCALISFFGLVMSGTYAVSHVQGKHIWDSTLHKHVTKNCINHSHILTCHVLHNTGLHWVPHTQRHIVGDSTAPVHPAPHSNDPDHMMDMAVWSLQCMNRNNETIEYWTGQWETGQSRFSTNAVAHMFDSIEDLSSNSWEGHSYCSPISLSKIR